MDARLERYLAQLATQRKLSPLTVEAYRRDLLELATLAGARPWEQIVHADIRRFAAQLHARDLSPRSIARKLSSWRGLFDWLSQQAPLAANPVDGVRAPRRAKTLPKALPVDAAVQLVSGGPAVRDQFEPDELCNRAMFELMYSSGLRVSELAGLDCLGQTGAGGGRSAGLARPRRRRGSRHRQGQQDAPGAGRQPRRRGDRRLAGGALPPRDGGNALFLSNRATRVSPRVIQLRLARHALQAGAAVRVHPHVLRHSFASHVLQSSGDLRAVQEMLGHASIASTQVYTALDFQHLAAVYDQAHPRAKAK